MFVVGAAPGCNLADDVASRVLFALLDTGIACISADQVLRAVQQVVDLGHVCDVGCSDHDAVHDPRIIVDTNLRFDIKVTLVALFRLVLF